jgi:hypothetical protein
MLLLLLYLSTVIYNLNHIFFKYIFNFNMNLSINNILYTLLSFFLLLPITNSYLELYMHRNPKTINKKIISWENYTCLT